MIGVLHTSAHLCSHEGCVVRTRPRGSRHSNGSQHAHAARDTAAKAERIYLVWRQLLYRSVPRRIGIPAEDGKHLNLRHHGVVPPCHRVERHIQSALDSQLLQGEYVLLALAWTSSGVFVLKLDADDGTAIRPKQSL